VKERFFSSISTEPARPWPWDRRGGIIPEIVAGAMPSSSTSNSTSNSLQRRWPVGEMTRPSWLEDGSVKKVGSPPQVGRARNRTGWHNHPGLPDLDAPLGGGGKV